MPFWFFSEYMDAVMKEENMGEDVSESGFAWLLACR